MEMITIIAQFSLCSQVCLVRLVHSPVGRNVSSDVSASLFIFVLIFVVVYHSRFFIKRQEVKRFTFEINYITLSGCNFTTSCQRGSVSNLIEYCNSQDLGCTTPQITVDYESLPMWWRHVSILLSKTPTLCWMWSGGALIQVSAL